MFKKIAQKVKKNQKNDDICRDDSRQYSFNIALMKMFKINKLNWDQIINMIMKIDYSIIDLDSFLSLENLAPNKKEKELAKNFLETIEKEEKKNKIKRIGNKPSEIYLR